MAVTRLKRKGRRNKLKAKVRAQKMKLEGFKPVIKQVDVESIKEEFKSPGKKTAKAAKEEKPAAKAEKVVEAKVEQMAEETTPAKKAPAKKKAAAKPKADKEEAAEKKPAKKKAAPKAKAEKKDEE